MNGESTFLLSSHCLLHKCEIKLDFLAPLDPETIGNTFLPAWWESPTLQICEKPYLCFSSPFRKQKRRFCPFFNFIYLFIYFASCSLINYGISTQNAAQNLEMMAKMNIY
jgi:hypothetical protein